MASEHRIASVRLVAWNAFPFVRLTGHLRGWMREKGSLVYIRTFYKREFRSLLISHCRWCNGQLCHKVKPKHDSLLAPPVTGFNWNSSISQTNANEVLPCFILKIFKSKLPCHLLSLVIASKTVGASLVRLKTAKALGNRKGRFLSKAKPIYQFKINLGASFSINLCLSFQFVLDL